MKAFSMILTLLSLNIAHASFVNFSQDKEVNSLVNDLNFLLDKSINTKFNLDIEIKKGSINPEKKSVCDETFNLSKVVKKNQQYIIKIDQRAFSEEALKCKIDKEVLEIELLRSYSSIIDHEFKISKDLSFQNAAGYFKSGLVFKRTKNLNQNLENLYSDINLKKPKNAFALYFSLYLKDEDFSCRHPSLSNYFNKKFEMQKESNCLATNTVVLNSSNPIISDNLIQKIDFSRVYQIHYLFAGKGRAAMSRWGHAMFRIVMCKPGREVGPDCMKDLSHHLVFGFRANVDELQISYLKGLKGKYESRIFIQSLYEIIEEYTDGEYRDVISLPMKFTTAQMHQFLNRSLEYYWTYKGKYYFLTNNCATEAVRLLKSAYLLNTKIQKENVLTPSGLYDLLIELGLVNDEVLSNEENAIYKGYLFKGADKSLSEALGLFVKTTKKIDEDLKNFQSIGAEKRLAIYKVKFNKHKNDPNLKAIVSKALVLETKFEKTMKQKLNNKILAIASGKIELEGLSSSQENYLNELVEVFTKFDPLKGAMKSLNNGLALSNEINEEVIKENINKRNEILESELGQEVMNLVRVANPSLIEEVATTNKAKKELIKILGLAIRGISYEEV